MGRFPLSGLLEGTQCRGDEKTVPHACQKGDNEDHEEEPRSGNG